MPPFGFTGDCSEERCGSAGLPFEVLGDLRRAAKIAATEVSLPVHPYLEDAEVDRVIDAVNGWAGA